MGLVERFFTLLVNDERRLYRWDGATLHKLIKVERNLDEQCSADVDGDLVAVNRSPGSIALYPGVISGELGPTRVLLTPIFGDPFKYTTFSSFVLSDGYLFAASTDQCRLFSVDLQVPDAPFVALGPPLDVPSGRSGTSALIAIDRRLLSLDYIASQVSWRIFDAPNPRTATAEPAVKVVVPTAHWGAALSQLRASASAFIVRSGSYGRDSHRARLSVFDRRTLELMFTAECPEFDSRGTRKFLDPFYYHVDAWDEQLLVCEHNRGIGILRDDALNSLRAQRKDGILDPATLHEAMRWISRENANIQRAFFCGSASIAAVWKDKTTGQDIFTQVSLSDL